ncbi:hypothetical protein IU500_28230 [Nocardia terpenica]|uniref:hypothetical protein n=1 Tax=Nocardia terpenica TaxID=455432 RepID=UPI001893243E|nr:hypothetical protein [Nocardia terpenica]MBF6065175.1 hypothetical protein [Nocardia terpenica]MBF6107902.1 hypothetical protein [Nocardia terpenica]MBF6115567.1 hypothetical protein [Nocardia terpenica]MBF6122004.1 hypothetical protein [Nocardia terpenica]MBF6155452.1 hypothetical protein [Nocardia terpenica]
MRAVWLDKVGGPWRVTEVPDPSVVPGGVLVDVLAVRVPSRQPTFFNGVDTTWQAPEGRGSDLANWNSGRSIGPGSTSTYDAGPGQFIYSSRYSTVIELGSRFVIQKL